MERLPDNTFELTAVEVPLFVQELQVRFGISHTAEQICVRALFNQFRRFGGYKEQPLDDNAVWMPYHNGSHPAYVIAVGLLLASEDNRSQETKDVIAVAGAYHDWFHHFKESEKNERESANAMRAELEATSLTGIMPRVEKAILGTIVKRIGQDGIHQYAEDMPDEEARYIADADLSSLVSHKAAAWALRLQVEHQVASGGLVCRQDDIERFYANRGTEKMSEFLSESRNLQLKHKFLSPAGQKVLQPWLAVRAAELEDVIANKQPMDYFDPKRM